MSKVKSELNGHTHPMQQIQLDDLGIPRFKSNAIVEWMLDMGRMGNKFDMNTIAIQNFSDEDRIQLAQLIGYSVNGFGELSYVQRHQDIMDEADTIADELKSK